MGQYGLGCGMLGSAILLTALSVLGSRVLAQSSLPTAEGCRNDPPTDIETSGWCIAIQENKGNCLACHEIDIMPWPKGLAPGGNLGPALASMRHKFPDKAKLRAQIWDATKSNPRSIMPPYGKHKVLSEHEIDLLVEFLLKI